MSHSSTLVYVQSCLDKLIADGNEQVYHELLEHSYLRLRKLAAAMFREKAVFLRKLESDDLLHNAIPRLKKAVLFIRPKTVKHYFGLAAVHMRWELKELARRNAAELSRFPTNKEWPDKLSDCEEPSEQSSIWSDFHEHLAKLPENERVVVELIWYNGLTHEEAAEELKCSSKTISRRLDSAIKILRQKFPINAEVSTVVFPDVG